MTDKPEIKQDEPLYKLLREGRVADFNQAKSDGMSMDLRNCDFRGINLRGLDAAGLDLSGCYFRQADLRGIDLRETNLLGASIHSAKISGTYFPDALSAEELTLSLMYGTRLRYQG